MNFKQVFYAIIFSLTANLGVAKTLNVYGWHGGVDLFRKGAPDPWLGDDAVVGRQLCPTLLRYNLTLGKPDPVLLKSLPEVEDRKDALTWIFSLRPNLKWSSGASITPSDLVSYLQHELGSASMDTKYAGTLKVTLNGANAEAQWSTPPSFGPYVLSGKPFWRTASSHPMGYECAGLYKIASSGPKKSLVLEPAAGYTVPYTKIKIEQDQTKKEPPYVSFEFAEDLSTGSRDQPKEKSTCSAKLDVPIITAITWNMNGRYTNLAKVRQALTHAVPRGEILRTAGGDLGSLISAPFLRIHPAYASRLVVRNYSLETADQLLSSQGLSQASIGMPRKDSNGNIMHLRIGTTAENKQEVVEKIITDSFASIGIEVEFVAHKSLKDPKEMQQLDGVISGIALPWPSADLTETFGASGGGKQHSFPFFSPDDKPLNELLLTYSSQYSWGRPDFDALNRFHARFMEIEPWTLIMSHKACVLTKGIAIKGKVSALDPDWFRRQLLD